MKSSSHLASRPAYFVYGAIVVVAAVIVGAMFVSPLLSPKQQFATYNVDSEKVAIHGYDTVAYFTEGKPTKGKEEFEHVWEDARWQFASVTNRELFKANPERYAPQFGGYCAGGLAVGEYVPNSFDAPAPDFSPYALFPVERTFSEWKMSEYNSPSGVYAPQFGGYCAGGLAVGEYADGDPKLFTIVDDKLYFIKNEHFLERWSQAPEAHIEFAEYNWDHFRGELRDNMEFVQH